MEILAEGRGELLSRVDPEEHREWVLKEKNRSLDDKTTTLSESVSKYVKDDLYIAFGGFGHVRTSFCAIYEIVRQGRRNLTMAAKPGVHDVEIMAAGGCISKVDRAYAGGHEVRGLSPAFRRAVESGTIGVVEWSNAGFEWRLKAAGMGLPFIPTRTMLGSDTMKESAAKVIECPYTGRRLLAVPACYPDVSFIHVDRCDKFGNAQIDGITIMDYDLARASRRLVLTTEEVVDERVIRAEPWRTIIPYYFVDAVVEIPYGAHPSNMPHRYYFDEEHIGNYLIKAKTTEGTKEYLDKYIHGVKNFDEYLDLVGGVKKLSYLRKLEQLREMLKAPWIEGA